MTINKNHIITFLIAVLAVIAFISTQNRSTEKSLGTEIKSAKFLLRYVSKAKVQLMIPAENLKIDKDLLILVMPNGKVYGSVVNKDDPLYHISSE